MTLPFDLPVATEEGPAATPGAPGVAAAGLTFTVYGEPIPKGSTKAFVKKNKAGKHYASVTNDNDRTAPWQALVSYAAREAIADMPPLTGAVEINLRFTLPRGSSIKRPHPITRPDLDKLVRAALDGLQGCMYVNDSQVTRICTEKSYVNAPGALRQPGLVVEIMPVLA